MRIHVVLLLFLAASDGIYGCLTWDIDGDSIRFICRIEDDSRTVRLVDNDDKDLARCAINGSSGNCSSFNFVRTHIQKNLVTFYIDINRKTDVDGNWTCLQNENKFVSEVLTSRELADITIVKLLGKVVDDDDAQRILLTCSSCRIPKGKNAEFLMNNSSVDSITFNDETGKCTHRHGECTSDKCNCSPTGNKFSRILLIDKPLNPATNFSCDMRFEDEIKSEVFSKVPTVYFQGKEFKSRGTRTVITQLSDDNNHPEDNDSDAVEVEVLVVVLSIFTVVAIVLIIGVYSHRKKRKSEKNRRNGADTPFIEMKNKTVEKHVEESIQSNTGSLQCVIYRETSCSITETKTKTVDSNVEEPIQSDDDGLQCVILREESCSITDMQDDRLRCITCGMKPYTIETNDQSVQVNYEDDILPPGRSLQHFERNLEPFVTIEHDGKSVHEVSVQVPDNDSSLSMLRTVEQESNTNTDTYEQILTKLRKEIGLNRPAHPVDAKLDVIFMNCDSLIELKWVLRVAEVLEKEFKLHCGIPGIDIESFKCVSETSKVIITFAEKSSRIPDALKMAEFLPVVVIVMVEECSIPIQLTNMKCVDATTDTNTWLNQLLIALKLKEL